MTKFKIGDRVRAIDDMPEGYEGIVIKVEDDLYLVEFDSNDWNPINNDPTWWLHKDELELVKPEKTLYNLEQGDFVISGKGSGKMVLGVCGEVYYISKWTNHHKYDFTATANDLEEKGYKPLVEEEEKKEETDPYLQALSDIKKWSKGRKVTKDSLREFINKLKKTK